MKQELIRISAACAVSLAMLAGTATAQEIVIRAATTLPDTDGALAQSYRVFADQIALRSGGTMRVEMFWGGTLGGDREIYEQIQDNSIQLTHTADGPLAGFYPPIQAISIPFLFKSDRHAFEFFDTSEVFAEMKEGLRQNAGLRVLTVGGVGFRNFTNNTRQFHTPADMAGLRIRTMESPVMMEMTRGLGAEPTPIAFNELIPSLLTGVVTGQENAVSTVRDFSIYEAQQYMSINEHLFGVSVIAISDAFFNSLTEEQRRIVMDSALVMRDVYYSVGAQRYAQDMAYLADRGLQIHVNTAEEKAQFAAASQPAVIEFLNGRFGAELVQRVLDDAAAAERSLYNFD